jgi:diguanylate cyclase (GGDEF)-like protein
VCSNGTALGTLCVIDTQPRQLDVFQLETLTGLSRQVSALLELRRTTQQLRHQLAERQWYETQLTQWQRTLEEENALLAEESRTDPLTGLPNRRALQVALTGALEKEPGRAVAPFLALVDVDHFKTINDLYGHARGDEALVEIAQVLHAQRPPSGVVARFGGEEFAMLLPSTTAEAAELQCEYVREAVQNLAGNIPVTVSIGLAGLVRGDSATSWCERADRALYAAKRNGRNRVVRAEP